MKLLLLLTSLLLYLQAFSVYEIKDDFTQVDVASSIYYLHDKNSILNAIDILQTSDLKQLSQNTQLQKSMGPFWTKLEVTNNSLTLKNLIFYNLLPGINYIDTYIYKNDELYKKHLLGDMRKQNTKDLLGRYSMFELTLMPHERFTIISKIDNYNINNLSWMISDSKFFSTSESRDILLFGLVGGIVLLFSLLNFILFGIYKSNAYLLIGLHTLNYFIYFFSLQGVFYYLDIGINLSFLTLVAWTGPTTGSILILAFTYDFFNIKQKYKKFFYTMLLFFAMHASVMLIILYAFFIDQEFFKYSFLIGMSVSLNIIYLLSAGFYMKEIGSKFYLIGQIILFVSVVLSTLSIYGIISYHTIYRHIVTIALMTDMVLLLLAQSYKMKQKLLELNSSKIALVEYSRFSSMGLAINNIVHQWKHPLAHIGMSIALIQSILKNKKDEILPYIESELPEIEFSLTLMNNTIDEFSTYYASNLQKEFYYPKETLENIQKILKSKILINNAQFNVNIGENIEIYGYEHIFSNIFMILIDNSLEEFKNRKNNLISIQIDALPNSYELIYSDNAGGISIKPIEKVFDYFVSTKIEKSVHGVGLALVKILVTERLLGTINVQNKNNGVEFKILIPNEKN